MIANRIRSTKSSEKPEQLRAVSGNFADRNGFAKTLAQSPTFLFSVTPMTTDTMEADLTLRAEINLYYDLFKPARLPAPLLIALHGYGANKRQMMREARQVAPESFAVLSLQGFHQHIKEPKEPGGPLRFGFGWLTNFRTEDSVAVHHRALIDLIKQLTLAGVADEGRIFLLGFSQTCALNYRFAFAYPNLLRGVIGICGGLPGDWETGTVYQPTNAAVFHLAGNQDEFYGPARSADYQQRLGLRAAAVDFKNYDAGHEMVPAMREDIRAWLNNHS